MNIPNWFFTTCFDVEEQYFVTIHASPIQNSYVYVRVLDDDYDRRLSVEVPMPSNKEDWKALLEELSRWVNKLPKY